MTGVLPRTARELVPETLFHRLAASITAAHGEIDHDMAERITCETLKFLAACATDPDGQLAPSPLVDVGWHAFLVHTREYAEFCRDVAGQFIHHVPRGQDTPSTPVSAATVRGRTLAAIRTAGYAVDPELWPVESATCDQDSCSASGQDGNENTDTQLPPPLGRRDRRRRQPAMTRMGWNELPRTLRVALHDRLGQVCAATDLDVGQNNDLSVRLDRPGLPPVFCKGVHGGGRRGMFLNNEIATNSLVEGIAPAILCHVESGDWQVVAFEFVPGRPADLSPGSTDLTAVARVVDTLSTRSAGGSRPLRLRWHRTDWWRTLAESSPDIVRDCDVAELHRLATECPGQVDGDRLLHTDLHADQFVIVGSHVRVIDWAFPAAGAPWVDAAFVLIRLILAGHSMCEAEAWARELRCWATSSDQAVTAFAAYVAGMWSCWAARDPEPGAVHRARAARAYAAWRVGERVGNS